MLVSMKSILTHADENNYAVMAVNCINMELVKAIIGAAEQESSAVIINISPRQMKAHATPSILVPMIIKRAKQAKVPIVLNLDHGQLYDDIVEAINNGFSSVMYDGSALDFEENIVNTAKFSSLAHDLNLSIEGEIGHVGQASNNDNDKQGLYTNPELAKEFLDKTNVDCLAVAIGTAHGKYPENFIPKLDFERLKAIKETVNIPLALHGGSGTDKHDIEKAIEYGINKINVCTDVFNVGRDAIFKALKDNQNIDYMDVQHVGELAMKEYICEYMKLIGSSGRYMDVRNDIIIVE